MTEFTIGCDPEIFLKKNGEAYSAHGVIPGTKKEPFKVDNGAYQVDGMAVEFNTDPVSLAGFAGGDFNAFNHNITSVMSQMEAKVKEYDPELEFYINSVQDFSEETMKSQPPEAVELGCDPDFNAYTLEVNPRPEGEAVSFRTTSGHIHMGWGADIPVDNPEHLAVCASIIKYLDATVGMYMTIIDSDPRRRTLYGKAGAFRPKSYGVEYRTPSNLWLVNEHRRMAIFELCQSAVVAAQSAYTINSITGYSEDHIREIIDNGNYTEAFGALKVLRRNLYVSGVISKNIEEEFAARRKVDQPASKKAELEEDTTLRELKLMMAKSRVAEITRPWPAMWDEVPA